MTSTDFPTFRGRDLACMRGERLLFQGIDFALGRGDALILVGPNGSGKSSLLRIMAGLLRPTAGRLGWDDGALADDPDLHYRRTCYVGHADPVKSVLSVTENLAFWGALADAGGATGERVAQAVAGLGCGRFADLPGRFLSAGQRRRANLARLLLGGRLLWLLDEPATALDREGVATMERLIHRHRETGGMVALSTHAELSVPGARVLALTGVAGAPGAESRTAIP